LREVIRTPKGILILQRHEDGEEHNPGIWEFAGGRFEGGSLRNNLVRETREETKIVGNQIGGLGVIEITVETPNSGKYKDKIVINIYINSPNKKNYKVKISKEHQKFKWVAKESDIKGLKLDPITKEILQRIFKEK